MKRVVYIGVVSIAASIVTACSSPNDTFFDEIKEKKAYMYIEEALPDDSEESSCSTVEKEDYAEIKEKKAYMYIEEALPDDSEVSSCSTVEKEDYAEIKEKMHYVNWFDVKYVLNEEGKYVCRGSEFESMVLVSGKTQAGNATFVVLTNATDLDFKKVERAISSSDMTTGEPEFVILGWY